MWSGKQYLQHKIKSWCPWSSKIHPSTSNFQTYIDSPDSALSSPALVCHCLPDTSPSVRWASWTWRVKPNSWPPCPASLCRFSKWPQRLPRCSVWEPNRLWNLSFPPPVHGWVLLTEPPPLRCWQLSRSPHDLPGCAVAPRMAPGGVSGGALTQDEWLNFSGTSKTSPRQLKLL